MENKTEYKGYSIDIAQDIDSESPREWDNLGKMVCWHSRYDLGDKHDFEDPEEFLASVEAGDVVLPLFLYDHSGITMRTRSFNDQWDSGQVGYIIARKEDYLKEFNQTKTSLKLRNKVRDILEAEVKTYDQFLVGDVYGYSIEKIDSEAGNRKEDSLWGLYGYDYALSEAKAMVDWFVEEDRKEKQAETKKKIKSNVPLIYR